MTIFLPATLLRWHREAFRLLWRWRSRPSRPRLPTDLQQLTAAELLVKLGLRVSPRTVRRYMVRGTGGGERRAATQQ